MNIRILRSIVNTKYIMDLKYQQVILKFMYVHPT